MTQTLRNLVAATNDIRCMKDELYPTVLRTGLDKGITFHFNPFSALVLCFFCYYYNINKPWSYTELHCILDLCGHQALNELESEVKSFRVVLDDVLVKFKSLSRELQSYRDADAKVRADLRRIRGSYVVSSHWNVDVRCTLFDCSMS